MTNALARAEALVGTRARLQGRDPSIALDCVGVVLEAFSLPHSCVRNDYGLRGHDLQQVDAELSRYFRKLPCRCRQVGDVLVMRCAHDRFHVGICGVAGLIHADLLTGKVIRRPGVTPWPVIRVYRRRKRRS